MLGIMCIQAQPSVAILCEAADLIWLADVGGWQIRVLSTAMYGVLTRSYKAGCCPDLGSVALLVAPFNGLDRCEEDKVRRSGQYAVWGL
jgi:hypothetical protein